MQNLLKQNNVIMYSTQATNRKPSIIERFNRTLKELMWKFFAESNSNQWVDVLGNFTNFYNNKFI